jgi:proteasome alpha subunit
MTSEPFRWLEAIGNRREYIRDQLKGATPVFALSRPEGVLLVGVGNGQSKVFEIFDRHALAALGHPVDIEKLRQTAIEAAHMEGFTRAPADVTLRRLINFSLSTALKNAFEQIASPPLIVESVFAEVGAQPENDLLVRLHFDGRYTYETKGTVIAHVAPLNEQEAQAWIAAQLRPDDSLLRATQVCLAAWTRLVEEKPFAAPEVREGSNSPIEGRVIEIGLLDRRARGPARYRAIAPEMLG